MQRVLGPFILIYRGDRLIQSSFTEIREIIPVTPWQFTIVVFLAYMSQINSKWRPIVRDPKGFPWECSIRRRGF